MDNYFIFKNIDSRNVKGLIVQELPPISKAQKRIERIEIEGKDGDIIKSKGYSAYDKTINIGLTRDYDINEIINWLDGVGNLIMSNEDDKYYKAEIVSNIDFERLIMFKTASIKFHVQPYKFLINEPKSSLSITTQKSLDVTNKGFIESRPIIKLFGNGIVEISINSLSIFKINIDNGYVVVDSDLEEAYREEVLKNNLMQGEFPILKSGKNVITWSGTLTKLEVEIKSRWL